jgi:hypothetical protein
MKKQAHLRDEDLLLYADNELNDCSSSVKNHLEGCASCRARIAELKRTLTLIEEAHFSVWDGRFPAPDEARATLKARMAEIETAKNREARPRSEWIPFLAIHPRVIQWGSVAVGCLLLLFLLRPTRPQPAATFAAQGEEPNLHLTPGVTVPVTESQICGPATSSDPAIPVSLKEKVLAMYGVKQSQPDQYEIDYLITPELGGATDVRNLWPEPYHDAVWNAHVKDQLEDQLHRMVCRGDVDLATAQHDISTDWIAAYRKYFHVEAPLTDGSSLNSRLERSLPST